MPALAFGALIPYFFLFKASEAFTSYTFVALAVAFSIYHLRPDMFFERGIRKGPLRGFSYWGITLGLALVTFLFLVNYTLPYYILLVLGWLACSGHGAFRLWRSARSSRIE